MGLASSLISLSDGTLPASFEGLKSQVDVEWVKSSLTMHGVATVRNRKLAVEQVMWLVVGMALYRDRPIAEIVRRLDLVLPGPDGKRQGVSQGAIPPARDRVGPEPVRELFETTARHWALASAERHRWHGLMVLGADGTGIRVPDTKENRTAFGLPGSSRRSAGYPQVRAVGLMVLRSHLLLGFNFAGCRTGPGEIGLATLLLERLPSYSLVVLDRYYINYHLWHQIRAGGEERHWLARGRKGLKWRAVKSLGRGDALVEIEFPRNLRAKHPDLPEKFLARVVRYRRKGFRPQVLLTSLLDAEKYPTAEIAELYHERWELELGYDEIKTHALERMEAIRSKTPERVAQELWGLAVAYNLVRHEMEAVAADCGVPPRRISFRGSLRLIRDLFYWA
ncbi:MAG: IS4 family transposase [Elusimicrobia bacterium]|nr:IS4 family transposase [Elusimicrobiota bacterium]